MGDRLPSGFNPTGRGRDNREIPSSPMEAERRERHHFAEGITYYNSEKSEELLTNVLNSNNTEKDYAMVRFGIDTHYEGNANKENAKNIISAIQHMKEEVVDRKKEIYTGIRENEAVRWACNILTQLSRESGHEATLGQEANEQMRHSRDTGKNTDEAEQQIGLAMARVIKDGHFNGHLVDLSSRLTMHKEARNALNIVKLAYGLTDCPQLLRNTLNLHDEEIPLQMVGDNLIILRNELNKIRFKSNKPAIDARDVLNKMYNSLISEQASTSANPEPTQ